MEEKELVRLVAAKVIGTIGAAVVYALYQRSAKASEMKR